MSSHEYQQVAKITGDICSSTVGKTASYILERSMRKEEKIRKVGKDIHPGEEVQVIEGEGRTAMPGLIDCHIHIVLDGAPDHSMRGLREPLSMMTIKAVAGQRQHQAGDEGWLHQSNEE